MTSFSLQDSAGPLEIVIFPRGMSACGGGCQDHTKCLELGMTELQKTCGYAGINHEEGLMWNTLLTR